MAATKGRGFLRQAWDLTWPYWKSDEKWSAIGLLAIIVALNLFSVWLNVRFNRWNNDFYNALQEYKWSEFWYQFGIFGALALAMIVDAVYALYLRQILHIRWRRWLTDRYLHRWLDNQNYYRMQLNQAVTDNPDQRISDDIDSFATMTIALSLGLLNAVVTLLSFLTILWVLSGALMIPLGGGRTFSIPGYMVFAALIYAVGGTFLTRWIGNPLVRLTLINNVTRRISASVWSGCAKMPRTLRSTEARRANSTRSRRASNGSSVIGGGSFVGAKS